MIKHSTGSIRGRGYSIRGRRGAKVNTIDRRRVFITGESNPATDFDENKINFPPENLPTMKETDILHSEKQSHESIPYAEFLGDSLDQQEPIISPSPPPTGIVVRIFRFSLFLSYF